MTTFKSISSRAKAIMPFFYFNLSSLAEYKQFTGKVSWAVFDQALFAGGNFIVNILLARWMETDQYGAFVLAYSWFLLIQNFYEAIIVDPMAIFGAGKYSERFRRYLGFLYQGHFAISTAVSVALLFFSALSYFLDSQAVGLALLGMGLATPFMLTRWFVRQPFYIQAKPQKSALSSGIYTTLSIIGIGAIYYFDVLTPFSAMVVMGATSLISFIIVSVFMLKPTFVRDDSGTISARSTLSDHWNYGRWSTSSRILSWVQSNIYYLVLPTLVSLDATAGLSALIYLIFPIIMTVNGLMALVVPTLVRSYHNNNKEALAHKMNTFIKVSLVVTSLYFVMVVILGDFVIHLVYNGRYDSYVTVPVVVTMALIPLTMAPYAILRSGVVAMGGIKDVFFTRIFPTLWTLTGGILLLSAWGIAGANVASIVGNLIGLYLIVRVLKRKGIFVSVQNTVAETTAITADSITESDVAPDPIDENAPGISVIMPAYNSTKYIGEAIQSILNQTYTKWELIVVDDGSTDDTVQVVQKYIDQDSRIRLYKNEHGGPSQARNTAIEHAQYDWLALLDADDIALPQRFAKQIAAATADPEVAVWGSFVSHINAKGKILSIHKVGPTSILEFQEQLKKGYVPQVINPSVLMKKEMINKVGDYDKDFPAAQDLELFDRIAQHGPIVAVSEVLTYYRVHGDAISMSKFFTQRELAAYVRLRSQNRISGTETPSLADYLSAQKQTSLVNRMMKRHSDYYAYFYRRAGHEYSQDHFIRACWYLTVSSFLNPRYALRRVWKQKLAPNLSSLKLGVLSRARALPFWANSPRTDMP